MHQRDSSRWREESRRTDCVDSIQRTRNNTKVIKLDRSIRKAVRKVGKECDLRQNHIRLLNPSTRPSTHLQ